MIYQYDASNEKCPLPLVKLRVILKKMSSGDTCIIRIADSGSLTDIPKLLTKLAFTFSQKTITGNITELTIKSHH